MSAIVTTVTRRDLACLLCARVAGYVQDGVAHPAPGTDPALLARLRCAACGGRLMAGGAYERPIVRPLTPAEADERRGPGRPPTPAPRAPLRSCEGCGTMGRLRRCQRCSHDEQRKWPGVVEILADGLPHRAGDIRAALGVSGDSLRQLVYRARREGYPIRSGLPFGTYQMEGRP